MASPTIPQNPFLPESERSATPSSARPIAPVTPPPAPREPFTQPTPVPTAKPTFGPSPEVTPARNIRRFLPWIAAALVLILLGVGIFFWMRSRPTAQVSAPEKSVTQSTPTTETTPLLPPEPGDDHAEYRSENFKLGEIAVGGEAEFLSSETDVAPLEISNIRGEAFNEKNKQEVQLVVTWTTNRLSLADVNYAKGVGQTGKTVTEDDYSFNHSLIITGLDPASTYLYTIKSRDRFGNEVTSEPHAVFTGARSVSLFDLIAGAIGDVFGWAVNK